MHRPLLRPALVAFGALTIAAAQVEAQLPDIVITAGPTFPTGAFGDTRDLGYHVGIGAGFSVPLLPLALRAEALFNEFERTTPPGGSATRVWSVTANALFNPPTGLGPYVIGGLGIYNTPDSPAANAPSSTQFGFNIGGGYRIGLTGFNVFAEARYHRAGDAQYIPVSVGVTF